VRLVLEVSASGGRQAVRGNYRPEADELRRSRQKRVNQPLDGRSESSQPRNAVLFTVPEVEDELSSFPQVHGHAAEKTRLRCVEPVELLKLLLTCG